MQPKNILLHLISLSIFITHAPLVASEQFKQDSGTLPKRSNSFPGPSQGDIATAAQERRRSHSNSMSAKEISEYARANCTDFNYRLPSDKKSSNSDLKK